MISQESWDCVPFVLLLILYINMFLVPFLFYVGNILNILCSYIPNSKMIVQLPNLQQLHCRLSSIWVVPFKPQYRSAPLPTQWWWQSSTNWMESIAVNLGINLSMYEVPVGTYNLPGKVIVSLKNCTVITIDCSLSSLCSTHR